MSNIISNFYLENKIKELEGRKFEIEDGSVTPEKTSFLEKRQGKNLFNCNSEDNENGVKLTEDGGVSDDGSLTLSHFIPVETGEYTLSYISEFEYLSIRTYSDRDTIVRSLPIYNSSVNKNCITITNEEKYVRINCITSLKNQVQFEKGSSKTDFEEYKEKYILKDMVEDLEGKVDKVEGKGLSTEDYTTEEKTQVGKVGAINEDVNTIKALLFPELIDVNVPSGKIWLKTSTGTYNDLEVNEDGFFELSVSSTMSLNGKNITHIFIGSNANLTKLVIYNNEINRLDVSACTNIRYIHIHDNPICNNRVAMENMLNSLPDRNGKAFGSIVVSNQEIRREVEPIAIEKDWYFGSTIQYDTAKLANCDNWLKNTHVMDIWESAEYGEGANVCILDSGFSPDLNNVDYSRVIVKTCHPELGTGLPANMSTNTKYHGNTALCTIGGNGTKIQGCAPKCNMYCIRMADDDGIVDKYEYLEMIRILKEDFKDITFATYSYPIFYNGGYDITTKDIFDMTAPIMRISDYTEAGGLFIQCGGNSGDYYTTPIPEVGDQGTFKGGIEVGALWQEDNTSTNWTSPRNTMDVSTYGTNFRFEKTKGDYSGIMSGTSQACQSLAGYGALIFNLLKKKLNREPSSYEMYDFIITRTDKSKVNDTTKLKMGNGRFDFMAYNSSPFKVPKIIEYGKEWDR